MIDCQRNCRWNFNGECRPDSDEGCNNAKPNNCHCCTYLRSDLEEHMRDTYDNTEDDYIYLDPPYAGTKGMYYGTIDYDKLWDWLRQQSCKYALSFDGTCGKEDRTYEVPTDLYNIHTYLSSGNSGFKKLRFEKIEEVKESLYLKNN